MSFSAAGIAKGKNIFFAIQKIALDPNIEFTVRGFFYHLTENILPNSHDVATICLDSKRAELEPQLVEFAEKYIIPTQPMVIGNNVFSYRFLPGYGDDPYWTVSYFTFYDYYHYLGFTAPKDSKIIRTNIYPEDYFKRTGIIIHGGTLLPEDL